ncbi:hypothetical protein DNI29_21885 [Hymenobacter sediminis]|uniref:hypothetical protein n=1 Tax=Hymenobacter sediminis TaxID=2218621 RepID=UPI000DA6A863|nr:hypothetical protein [Hymenobacter sediminis]RPD44359.1 hypothetical protein DNI29_21885 [Hymenobacter sediminis]
MAISKPPIRKAPAPALPAPNLDEKKVEEVINRGSSSLTAPDTADVKLKNFNIKLPATMLAVIDELRAKRPRKPTSPKLGISTQDWLLEAIQEKIQREQKKYK